MKAIHIIIFAIIAVALVGATIRFQTKYKYSCAADDQCYPCTRWMNCVNEEFYIRNTGRCRIGAEENFTRISCGCHQGMCTTDSVKPFVKPAIDAWAPPDD